MHPRNQHQGRYDLIKLQEENPFLTKFIKSNPSNELTIDFSNAEAVKALNKALLRSHYQIKDWDIPAQFLCPPIPGRADYIHYLSDLITESNSNKIRGLDIGVGANLIYPLIGFHEYAWQFVGVDINQTALDNAQIIIDKNGLNDFISLRLQSNQDNVFKGVITKEDRFDFVMCNPPFHGSIEEAQQGTRRKINHLAKNIKQPKTRVKNKVQLNFGGQASELYCEGGELGFIQRMIMESIFYKNQCVWFTTLVSKESNLLKIKQSLRKVDAKQIKVIKMSQGQKQSRFVAWSFQ
jgi:23S rRNA (adenine1618-N6)-methyltransferase